MKESVVSFSNNIEELSCN